MYTVWPSLYVRQQQSFSLSRYAIKSLRLYVMLLFEDCSATCFSFYSNICIMPSSASLIVSKSRYVLELSSCVNWSSTTVWEVELADIWV